MFIELHILQNFAPSCLNRDDTNSPKDCVFGGIRRARISSQCFKRSIRETARRSIGLDGLDFATRTKRLHEAVAAKLRTDGRSEEIVFAVAAAAIQALGLALTGKKDSGPDLTEYLLFLSDQAVDEFAKAIDGMWDKLAVAANVPAEAAEGKEKKGKKEKGAALSKEDLKRLEVLFDGRRAADLAMNGRMLADLPERNIDAACQVAHAISTNRVEMDMDFFTAVDDLQPDDASGASMMGSVEFNSSCFYRYCVIDRAKLAANLGDDAALVKKSLDVFIRATIDAIPGGKQNTFAAHNPPSFVLAVVREKGAPLSMANAFEVPARPRDGKGLVGDSIEKLAAYWGNVAAMYGTEGVSTCWTALGCAEVPGLGGHVTNIDALVKTIVENVG